MLTADLAELQLLQTQYTEQFVSLHMGNILVSAEPQRIYGYMKANRGFAVIADRPLDLICLYVNCKVH